MKNLSLKAAFLVALFFAMAASAAGVNANSATSAGTVGGANNVTQPAATAPYGGAASYNSMPAVTTSPNSYFGSSAYGTGMGAEGMSGPGGVVGTTAGGNYGASSGTTMSAPGSTPYDAGSAGSYVNPASTAPVYRQPLYGSPTYNPNSGSTGVTTVPSGTSTNLGY